MPAVQMNGFTKTEVMQMRNSSRSSKSQNGDEKIGAVLASKKMQLIEEEHRATQSNGFSHKAPQQDCEVFQDTQTLGPHTTTSKHSQQQDDEPIVIFDTQNNTSISQTAKDQFAAALLRLQSGLDVSTQRLDAIETKVDDLIKQHRLAKQQQSKSEAKNAGSWGKALLGEGKLGALLYLSWPVFVFVAMRTIERRNLLNKLA